MAEARAHHFHGKLTPAGRVPASRHTLRQGAAFASYEGAHSAHSMYRHGYFAMHGFSYHGRFVEAGRRGHKFAIGRNVPRGGGLQCVAFARADSGIELSGNASAWWDHAAGIYQRGSRPEPGSVLNFRANGVMRMGHVAVVNQVIDSRTVEIDHANWGGPGAGSGRVSRDISVVDVSPNNDWSAVRVGLGHSGDYGSIYPTYGFIYNRPDPGTMVASERTATPIPSLNPAPRDLRSPIRDSTPYDEVAEAPDAADIASFRRTVYRHRHHVVHHRRHHNTSL